MTHEFKKIVEEARKALNNGMSSVLASVVALDGSSYRRPGVRMLIKSNGEMIGAVSGGCVEKEILLQSNSVFNTGIPKVMTYDGRYRLGCEGILYILIEPFSPSEDFIQAFNDCLAKRWTFEIQTYYEKKILEDENYGSLVIIDNEPFLLNQPKKHFSLEDYSVFGQKMVPCFKLIIIGAEHDAVELCKYAAQTGWEVTVVAGISESKNISNFPGAQGLIVTTPEAFDVSQVDNETAIVLMTHSFAYDLRYLVALKNAKPSYIGLLGPTKRKNDMLNQFIEYCPNIQDSFLDKIHGPAGLNIGSETPQEIAISIVSEILAFTRKRNPISLSKKTGQIHSK